MRCVEAGAVTLLLAFAPSDGAVPKSVHEASLEAGLRVVVASGAGGDVAAVLSIPVGYANDAETSGSGSAAFMAGYATFELSRWSAAVGPESTLFRAQLPVDLVEAGLTELAKRLVADGVEDERLNHFLDQRKVAAADAADRLREAAWTSSRLGGRIADATRRNKDALKLFLNERVGSEGAVLALVGPGTPAALELAATHAFANLPRAKGVAPKAQNEAMPAAPRKTPAPAGATGGLVGLRLPWRQDDRGDRANLAIAWLEATLERDAALRVDSSEGMLIGFAVDATDFAAVAAKLDQAVKAAAGEGFDEAAQRTALAQLSKRAEALAQNPVELASRLATDGAAYADPLATFGRTERLKGRLDAGGSAERRRVGASIRPEGRIDVVPAAKRPEGT